MKGYLVFAVYYQGVFWFLGCCCRCFFFFAVWASVVIVLCSLVLFYFCLLFWSSLFCFWFLLACYIPWYDVYKKHAEYHSCPASKRFRSTHTHTYTVFTSYDRSHSNCDWLQSTPIPATKCQSVFKLYTSYHHASQFPLYLVHMYPGLFSSSLYSGSQMGTSSTRQRGAT